VVDDDVGNIKVAAAAMMVAAMTKMTATAKWWTIMGANITVAATAMVAATMKMTATCAICSTVASTH
jgi:hypothetical protein